MIAIHHERIIVTSAEIDVLGHVNNQVYLKWMEMVATNHSAMNGWTYKNLCNSGYMWVARRHWLEYLLPSFEGEVIDLYTWIQGIRSASSLRRYAFKKQGRLIFSGATEWAFLNREKMRPIQIPDEVRNSFTVVSPSDQVLKELGIDRQIRYSPSVGFEEHR